MKFIRLLFLLTIIFISTKTFASHIIGGEIYYTCTGDNTYEVTVVLYRDCTSATAFDNPAYLGIYNSDGDLIENVAMYSPETTDIPIEVDNPCLDVPPGLCIEQGIYTVTIELPDDADTYDLVYQRCCRNACIINIDAPEDTGSTIWQQIPPGSAAECNNSPVFNNYPPPVICVDDPLNFDHSASDIDGDSLAYKFYTPFEGASSFAPAPSPPPAPPYGSVDWATGYDVDYMVDASPELAIDVNTGLLTGTALFEGRYVVGIVAEEWRDGVLLGNHYRDFQFNVELCEPTLTSVIGVDGAVVEEVYLDCEDFTVNFDNLSTGADDYLWDFGDGTTSTSFEGVHVYADTGSYTVTLIANPGFVCADTAIIDVLIYNVVTADFDYIAGCSNASVMFIDQSVSTLAGDITEWAWDFGDGGSSTDSNPDYLYAAGGSYTVNLFVETEKGCTATITQSIDVLSGPEADFEFDDVCQNESAEFSNLSTIPDGASISTYSWNFGDGGSSTSENPSHNYDPAGTYTVTLITTANNGCKDTISYDIVIGVLPEAYAGPDDTITYLDYYTLQGEGLGSYSWFPATFVSDPFSATPEIRPPLTVTYTLTVTSPDGCVESDDVTIYVLDITVIDIPNAFSPNGDGINDELLLLTHSVEALDVFAIYNRWGQELFSTTDVTQGWDGTYNGKEQDMGSYVYLIRARNLDGSQVDLQGSVLLVR
ncbi:MAG: PKD domain-containing protein [Bacteroidetes bacterium]|nr:PKD domain-containing protein [Bacteroidota bacterium]